MNEQQALGSIDSRSVDRRCREQLLHGFSLLEAQHNSQNRYSHAHQEDKQIDV
jgi:hypothetical protein